ncbi:eps15 [Symbiodinium sp. KB8]|nr:eps15 [Symbiodinium sp. KB8]
MQQGHSSIQFSQQELEYYQQLYGIANPAGTQSIDSISGGQFLVLSDLPRESLHEIWKIASANATQGYLHVEGFYVACRLVAWAQSGIQPDPQCVYQEPPVLPDFPGLQRRSPSEPSGQGSRPQSVGGSEQSELQPVIGGRGRRQENTQRARSSSPRTFTVDRWAPSRREKRKYASLFKRTDWDQDGFVQGNEASELLERSGLERSSLGRAWELADQDCDGKLDFSEFVCLVHLVTCALRGQRIPGPGEGLPHQLALSLASLEPLEVLAAEREAREPAVAELPDPFAAGESFPSVETKDAGNWQSTGFEDTAAFASGFESEGGFASGGFQDSTADFGFPAFPDGQIDQPFEAGAAGAASWPQELPEFEQPVSAFDDGAFEGKDPFATDHLGLSGPAEQLQLVANFDGKLARKLRDEVDQLDTELRRLQDADVKLEQQAAHESRECERLLSQKQILERELAEDKQKLQQLQDARSNANLESLSLRRDRNHLSHELAFLRQVAENDEEMLLMLRQSNQYLEASHRNLESNSEMLKEIRKEVQVEIAKEREQLQLDQRQYAELKATLEQLSRPGQDPSSLSEDGPGKSLADTLTERLKPLPTSALLPPKSFPHREGV